MADLTKKIIFIVLYWISGIRLISAKVGKYCEWGICKVDEECCGENVCCPKTTSTEALQRIYMYYILAWILAGLIVVLTCGGLLKYRKHLLQLPIARSGDKIPLTGKRTAVEIGTC